MKRKEEKFFFPFIVKKMKMTKTVGFESFLLKRNILSKLSTRDRSGKVPEII